MKHEAIILRKLSGTPYMENGYREIIEKEKRVTVQCKVYLWNLDGYETAIPTDMVPFWNEKKERWETRKK